MRTTALFVLLWTLTACATPSVPDVEPLRPDPRLCADLKPEPPVQGGIVQPATPEEREATAAFLTGEAAARDWGRQGWERARIAKLSCR